MQIYFKNKRFSNRSVILLLALSVLVVVAVAFAKEYIFPLKYFGDANTVEDLINNPSKDTGDKSFMNTALVFRFLKLDRYVLTPFVTLVLYFWGVKAVFKRYKINNLSFINYTIITVYSAIGMVYLATYSKDLFLYSFVILPFIFLEKKKIILWTILVLIYAYFFRMYWLLVISSFWVIKLYFIKSIPRLIIAIVGFFFTIALLFELVLGISLSSFRDAANMIRTEDEAQTMIQTYITGEAFVTEGFNAIVTLFFLIIPIPLFLFLKPFYVLMFFLIAFIFYYFFKFLRKNIEDISYQNVYSLIISMLLVQSLFEPDFGSFLRHLSPFYPLLFIFLTKKQNLEIEYEKK